MIIENFGGSNNHEVVIEGKVMLKTRTDKFKEHWAQVSGRDLMCFRKQGDSEYRVMHCLAGTFVSESSIETDPDNGKALYPVKVVLPPNKSRILYFLTVEH